MGNQISKRKKVDRKGEFSHASFSDSASDNTKSDTPCQPTFRKIHDYMYPQTVAEANRQQGQHHLFKHIFQSSYFAPVLDKLEQSDSKVLDIGCGTSATWIIDMANDFPESTFYGVDIVEPFSLSTDISTSHIPSNCKFEKADVLDGLAYQSNTFDYVHQRMMYAAYSVDYIDFIFQEIKRVTKLNGWVEVVEGDIVPKNAGPKFAHLMESAKKLLCCTLGQVFHGPHLEKKLTKAGFVDITSDYASLPVCWGGSVGKLFYEDLLVVFHHLGPSLYEYLDLGPAFDKSIFESYLDDVFDECAEYQTFFNLRWSCGKKVADETEN